MFPYIHILCYILYGAFKWIHQPMINLEYIKLIGVYNYFYGLGGLKTQLEDITQYYLFRKKIL